MFVGNSIKRHGVKKDIGWFNDFGMAASCKEKDNVCFLIKEIDKRVSARYFICRAGECVDCLLLHTELKKRNGNLRYC